MNYVTQKQLSSLPKLIKFPQTCSQTKTKASERCHISENTLGIIWEDFRQIATKWNIKNPPKIEGRCEYDELILSLVIFFCIGL